MHKFIEKLINGTIFCLKKEESCNEIKLLQGIFKVESFLNKNNMKTLYRGMYYKKEKLVIKEITQHKSLSYNYSILNGIFFDNGDQGACTYDYALKTNNILKIIIFNNNNPNINNYFIPKINPYCQIFGSGELFHVRSKFQLTDFTVDEKSGLIEYGLSICNNDDCKSVPVPEYLIALNEEKIDDKYYEKLVEYENDKNNYFIIKVKDENINFFYKEHTYDENQMTNTSFDEFT